MKSPNAEDLSRQLIFHLFGVINRREDIEEVVQMLGDVARAANKELVLSIRFLISFICMPL